MSKLMMIGDPSVGTPPKAAMSTTCSVTPRRRWSRSGTYGLLRHTVEDVKAGPPTRRDMRDTGQEVEGFARPQGGAEVLGTMPALPQHPTGGSVVKLAQAVALQQYERRRNGRLNAAQPSLERPGLPCRNHADKEKGQVE